MKKKKVKILILSDLHLGSPWCRAEMVLQLLQCYDYEKLVLVGDVFEKGAWLQDEEWKVVNYLRDNRENVVCTDGNHDPASDGLVAKMLGIPVVEEHAFEVAGIHFLALHGHSFDKMCVVFDEPLVDKLFLHAVTFLKRFNLMGYKLETLVNYVHGSFSRHIAKKASRYAFRHRKDVIICGHTHQSIHIPFVRKGKTVHYWNCGDWADYLTVDEEGNVQSHVMDPCPPVVVLPFSLAR